MEKGGFKGVMSFIWLLRSTEVPLHYSRLVFVLKNAIPKESSVLRANNNPITNAFTLHLKGH